MESMVSGSVMGAPERSCVGLADAPDEASAACEALCGVAEDALCADGAGEAQAARLTASASAAARDSSFS